MNIFHIICDTIKKIIRLLNFFYREVPNLSPIPSGVKTTIGVEEVFFLTSGSKMGSSQAKIQQQVNKSHNFYFSKLKIFNFTNKNSPNNKTYLFPIYLNILRLLK